MKSYWSKKSKFAPRFAEYKPNFPVPTFRAILSFPLTRPIETTALSVPTVFFLSFVSFPTFAPTNFTGKIFKFG